MFHTLANVLLSVFVIKQTMERAILTSTLVIILSVIIVKASAVHNSTKEISVENNKDIS